MTADAVATLQVSRRIAAPVATVWQAWTAPAARALWSAPTPEVTVELLAADSREGGREVSLCKVAGQPDIRCEVAWLVLDPPRRSVNSEIVRRDGVALSAALVTARLEDGTDGAVLDVTVQLSHLAEEWAQAKGFGAEALGLQTLGKLARAAGKGA